jgi:hypothetical protein
MKHLTMIFIFLNCLIATAWATSGDSPTMLTEIRAAVDSTRNAELALTEEYSLANGPELARRLGELKKASRMRILHIQLKYAQKDGRTELVRRIQTTIEDLQRPMAPGGPRLTGRVSPSPVAKTVVSSNGGPQR